MTDVLKRLSSEHGQSPWLDNLQRGYLTSGNLASLVERGVRGLTSNPTIFQKAIQGSSDYDEQFRSEIQKGSSAREAYWELVLQDIHGAVDESAREGVGLMCLPICTQNQMDQMDSSVLKWIRH